ncbi:MAG: ABC transporter substrate-binding protein, partial [Actinomycetota bacterium]
MKRRHTLLAALLALVVVATACGGDDGGGGEADGGGEPITIGGLFDLTGATSDVGVPYSEGVRGYVEWRNANGGVADRSINLVWED